MGDSEIDRRVARKYRIHGKPVGQGSYGTVWKATRNGANRSGTEHHFWALKKCHDPFRNAHDAQGMFREVMVLRALKHENIVRLKEVLRDSSDKDLYLVFEYVDTTVLRIIESGGLSDQHRACIMHQLLNAVQYIHSAELVHRDIKPANMLISGNCQLRLADFGEARSLITQAELVLDVSIMAHGMSSPGALMVAPPSQVGGMTECGFTLWYNPPEVIVGSNSYGKPVDLWACGCVCGELLSSSRKPIFCGSSQLDQLTRHIALVGLPDGEADVESLCSPHAESMMRSVPWNRQCKIRQTFPDVPEAALSLLSSLLVFNPQKRQTARELLSHPFLADFHDPRKEREREEPVRIEFDGLSKLTAAQYQEALYTRLNLGGSHLSASPGQSAAGHSAMTAESFARSVSDRPDQEALLGRQRSGETVPARSRQPTRQSTRQPSQSQEPGAGPLAGDRLLQPAVAEGERTKRCCCVQ
eukprot:TRINITY_DN815_c1_g1_i1.p1 TRINITY_DN815_c1_g1~~TRINITY_DN815_c1_g1_i1.p1  ORF type:complete len:498 (+),score=131.18 TRINITY_DN815_c1_g1_i1:79-1494(+)